jgi:hypothetical protein
MASTRRVTVRRLHFKFEICHLDLKFFGLVLIFLAEARREAQHQLHSLDFIQPIGEGGVEFVLVGGDDAGGAERAELGRPPWRTIRCLRIKIARWGRGCRR